MQVVRDLASSSSLIEAKDNQGNTALHVAAQRGHLAVVEALILASPSSITATNNAGETFLHAVVAGFQTPGFRRLDRQIELMKHLLSGKLFPVEDIINTKNNQGRTALHLAILGNTHSNLVELLMTVRSIDVNIRDIDGLTPLDNLRQRPLSASSELLTRHLISAGGIFTSKDYSARRVIASHIKRQSMGSSPGTSFRISDVEIFLYTGLENASDGTPRSVNLSSYSPEVVVVGQESETPKAPAAAVPVTAAQRLKRLLHWPRMRKEKLKKVLEPSGGGGGGVPVPLRERFAKPSSNKRALSVRSSQPSPTAKKKLASGVMHGVMQAIPHFPAGNHRSRSSSFSKLSFSSQSSMEMQKGVQVEHEGEKGLCSNNTSSSMQRHGVVNRRVMNQYLCFGGPSHVVEAKAMEAQPYDVYERSVLAAA